MSQPRPLPHSEEIERAVLGIMLLWPEKMAQALAVIETPDMFYLERHQLIWRALVAIQSRDHEIHLRSLQAELETAQVFEKVGGMAYLAGMDLELPDRGSLDWFLQELANRYARRLAIRAGAELQQKADADEDIADVLERHAGRIREIQTNRPHAAEVVDARSIADAWTVEKPAVEPPGIRWTIPKLDEHAELLPGDVAVIGGRPGQGKSSFAQQVVWLALTEGKRVLYITLEMPPEQLVGRFVAQIAGGTYRAWVKPWLPSEEHKAPEIARAAARFADVPGELVIATPGVWSLEAVEARAMAEADKAGIDLLVIDYLQLMKIPILKGFNLPAAIGLVTKGIKSLTLRGLWSTLLLSQLSRDNVKADRPPRLEDLRDSGSIEQDADFVIFPYIPPVEGAQPARGKAELIVAKYRGGALGAVPCWWDGPSMTYRELTAQDEFDFAQM